MALTLGVLAALLAAAPARAADHYRITAGGNQDWGPKAGGLDQTAPTQLEATGTMTDDNGHADYSLRAGPGVARVSLDGHVATPPGFAPFNPSLQAVAETDLTIDGPTAEVNLSLNVHVDGVLESTVCEGPSCGTPAVHIAAGTGTTGRTDSDFNARGETPRNDLGLAFDAVPGGYHVHGDVTTRQFGLRTGTPNAIGIVLELSGRFGGNPGGETFGGSMEVSFATRGPVLNLPPGYTVSGSGVVDNRWEDPFADDVVVGDCHDPALGELTAVWGSLILHCDGVALPHLRFIGGDVVMAGRAGGDLDLSQVTVGGAIDVSGTGGDLTVEVGSVGGAIDVSGTGGDLTVEVGSVGGAIDVSGTGGDLTIDPGTTGGDLDITGNPDAGVIDVGAGQIGGDLTITDDGTAVVNADDSLTVSGDADIESTDTVTATTAEGTTDVTVLGGTAAMHVELPDGAFDQPVAFTITRRGDEPAEGGVDPLAGYAFAFAVPALNAVARLSFTVDLDALDAATRAALLAGIASGGATIATKPDGGAYTAFPRCIGTQTPAADGCVAVTQPTPSLARFDGIAGHFSTWAVALVPVRQGAAPPPAGGPPPGAPAAGPTVAQIRALLRSQITPHGRAGRIGALLKRGYRLPFRALLAGRATVAWYHHRVLIASGRRTFAAAGRATIVMRLAPAGRRQLRHARKLRLRARGTFTPVAAAPLTAARRFTLRR
jgi:hypothetical protein